MAPQIPYGEPCQFRAGDTVKWRRSFGDYPVSEGWVLSYALHVGAEKLTWDAAYATDDGNEWTVTLPDNITAGFTNTEPVVGRLVASVELGGERYTVRSASVVVLPNFAALAAGAATSEDEEVLAALKALRTAWLAGDGATYQSLAVDGHTVLFRSLDEIETWIAKYQRKVDTRTRGGRVGRAIAFRI